MDHRQQQHQRHGDRNNSQRRPSSSMNGGNIPRRPSQQRERSYSGGGDRDRDRGYHHHQQRAPPPHHRDHRGGGGGGGRGGDGYRNQQQYQYNRDDRDYNRRPPPPQHQERHQQRGYQQQQQQQRSRSNERERHHHQRPQQRHRPTLPVVKAPDSSFPMPGTKTSSSSSQPSPRPQQVVPSDGKIPRRSFSSTSAEATGKTGTQQQQVTSSGKVPRKSQSVPPSSSDRTQQPEQSSSMAVSSSNGTGVAMLNSDMKIPKRSLKKPTAEDQSAEADEYQKEQEDGEEEQLMMMKKLKKKKKKKLNNYVTIKSEVPSYVVEIKMPGLTNMLLSAAADSGRQTTSSPSAGGGTGGRSAKRKRQLQSYTEQANLTDSDDFLTDSDDDAKAKKQSKRKSLGSASASSGRRTPPSLPTAATSKKKKKLKRSTSTSSQQSQTAGSAAISGDAAAGGAGAVLVAADGTLIGEGIDGPPPGTLSSLWYSRESVLHLHVVDKIIGWKTRPLVSLEFNDLDEGLDDEQFDRKGTIEKLKSKMLDPMEAQNISTKLLYDDDVWLHTSKRMEVSRINPQYCPMVLPIAVLKEEKHCLKNNTKPRFVLKKKKNAAAAETTTSLVDNGETEEVFLVKWRGKSYMHCSWERRHDLEKMDISTSSTAKNKIRRYVQQQEVSLGKNWKSIVNQERMSAPDLHPHEPKLLKQEDTAAAAGPSSEQQQDTGETKSSDDNNVKGGSSSGEMNISEEEFFSPDVLEVERILACDENELDMKVLAKQRAINIQREQDRVRQLEKEGDEEANMLESSGNGGGGEQKNGGDGTEGTVKKEPTVGALSKRQQLSKAMSILVNDEPEEPWDTENNVRYVVKWKGLQYSELTWEYWRDIKTDAVDQAEDFWYRQMSPTLEEAKTIVSRPHPHIREFRKLTESPLFGLSERKRPVANLEGSRERDAMDVDDDENGNDTDEKAFKLRAYQLEGVNWLLFNWWNRRSCILADEMGLGKTIQTVTFLHQLRALPASQVRGPFLVVAPLSLIAQWQSESQSWAPDMNVVFYHGSADARDFIVKNEFYYTDQFIPKQTAVKLKKQHILKFQILITTYEVVLKDVSVLSKIKWKALIVDEAHRLKNPNSRLFSDLAAVPREFCLLLTGTPLQNSTEELWALLHFSDPNAFASKDEFIEKFGQLTDAKQVSDLHSVLKPYLLRRVKEDVEKSLPPKEETIFEVMLTPIQKTFYKAIYERNTAFLYKGSKPSNAPSLMNVMMELRKCCNHPFLVRGAEERILLDAATALKDKKDESGNPIAIDYLKLFSEHLVKSSGKIVLLEKLLPKLHSGGHKVLIFSQMVRVLDLLEELLKMKRYRYERLDGSTSASSRTAAVGRFHRKACNRFVMLLSTRAGGLGLNLTAADTVIIFDSDWNPQNDLQAMARAHRIGQTRAVRVYRLLTAKTYEMHMFHSASMKLGLDRAVLAHQRQQGDEDATDSKAKGKNDRQLQAKEIDELLKKGAYDVFRDDDDTEAQKFMETDIDQLLERSSRKVTYGNTNNSISSGLGSFSKASFVADTGGGGKDVDLDDPDFWEKAVGLDAPVEMPEEVAAMIDDGVKRSRKQVQVFDPYAAFAEAEQKKKDKIAQKLKEEKEERERIRKKKKQKKLEEKERKKREREEAQKGKQTTKNSSVSADTKAKVADVAGGAAPSSKPSGPSKSKKLKKSERKKELKRQRNENPILERLKQAWETPHRNRASAAALRFGFGRFCKIRNESNLTSLPIQDLESFMRSYFYQISLQASMSLLSILRDRLGENPGLQDSIEEGAFRPLIRQWLGLKGEKETEWICESIKSVVTMHMEVEKHRRFLRMPSVLAEPSYVFELRNGAAFRSLRRFGIASCINSVVEDALDNILSSLGHEELGKRGCTTKDLASLDIDLKARYVTTEELTLALGAHLRRMRAKHQPPAVWWDRSCDIGLIIGTFVHGFGNYEAMRNDEDLPFANRIRQHANEDDGCSRAFRCFDAAAMATRRVFDQALENTKAKAQEEAHRAVAAAVAAATKLKEQEGLSKNSGSDDPKEKDEGLSKNNGSDDPKEQKDLSKNGESDGSKEKEDGGTDGPSSNGMQTLSAGASAENTAKPDIYHSNSSIAAAPKKDDDTHLVTLQRLSASLVAAVRAESELIHKKANVESVIRKQSDDDFDLPLHHRLPMPDAHVLDRIVLQLTQNMEDNKDEDINEQFQWETYADVVVNNELYKRISKLVLCENADRNVCDGIGFSGIQCGSVHRSLDDGSSFAIGAASPDLVHIAIGNDAPRYLRAICVPMNVTRYAVSSLVYADSSTIDRVLATEKRYPKIEKDFTSPTGGGGTGQIANGSGGGAAFDTDRGTSESGEKNKTNKKPESTGGDKKDKDSRDNAKEAIPSPVQSSEVTNVKTEETCAGTNGAFKEGISIPSAFRDNGTLRASVCVAALHYGLPSNKSTVLGKGVKALLDNEMTAGSYSVDDLFSGDQFLKVVGSFSSTINLPDTDLLYEYMENVFLPHCLRLGLKGNGPATRNARGSKGQYETAYGVSLHPDNVGQRQSHIPDPALPLSDHSIEAVQSAAAILRRTRLMRTIYFIANDGVPSDYLVELLRRPVFRKDMVGLPIWWCPWVHDLALLVHAAKHGLFAILSDRTNQKNLKGTIFETKEIKNHARKVVLSNTVLAASSESTELDQWINDQSSQFPSANMIERRLALLCSELTSNIVDVGKNSTDLDRRYDLLPMFDHGGWPRN